MHFNALMKKNWINQKRQPYSTFCSLFCPGFLMLVLVYIRTLIVPTTVNGSALIALQRPFFPVTWTKPGVPDQAATSDSVNDFLTYDTYQNLTETNTYNVETDLTGPLALRATNCFKDASFTAPKVPAPIIAVVGSSEVTQAVEDYLTNILSYQDTFGLGFYNIQNYATQEDLFNYIGSENYLIGENVGVCFGFQVTNTSSSDFNVNLYFDDQTGFGGITGVGIPATSGAAWSPSVSSPNKGAYLLYTQNGFSYLQNLVANMVLRQVTSKPAAQINFMSIPIPSDTSTNDAFGQVLSGVLPLFLILIYLLPVYNTVFLIVKEKESRTKESCKMMGMTDLPYWLSWFTYYTIQSTIISFIAWGVLCINVIVYSNKGLIFLYFWLFGEAIFGQIVLLQALFQKSKYAGITSTIIYFGLVFFNFPVQSATASYASKLVASIVPQVANFQLGVVFAGYEATGVGLTSTTTHEEYDNYKFSAGLWMLFFGLAFFLLLGLYLDSVLPKEFGSKLHPCFCFKRSSYDSCCKKPPSNDEVDDENRESMLGGSQDGGMEVRNLKPENYEPVASEVARQEATGGYLRVEGLEKKFENGFHAVKGLNLKMYQSQIFALLGQNGAGKTTTISMLTGLIEKSEGKAKCFGVDMFANFEAVRKFMGICPQHDVLFDFLTPIEHLQVFYDFKGGDPSKKEKEISDLIRDVGLTVDKDKIASSLSGGNKRKLSVAIALCGGSKLVLLDEPTAGMDLGARRGLWDMLKNYRRDKIIILTTHYMDEADVLGDRIGIMAQGQMMCLGSSLFLKNRFGAGYKLTMVKLSKEKNTVIGPYLRQAFGEEVELQAEVSSEIAFQIPTKDASKFKDFFSSFDAHMNDFGIESYGISITTLEEVFLKINKEFKINIRNSENVEDAESEFKTEIMDTNELLREDNVDESLKGSVNKYIEVEDKQQAPRRLVGNSGLWDNIKALLTKRLNIYKRDRSGLACEVIVPFLCVVVGCLISFVDLNPGSPNVTITPNLYPSQQRIVMNSNLVNSVGLISPVEPSVFYSNLPGGNSFWAVTYDDITSTSVTEFYDVTFDARLVGAPEPYRYGSYQIYSADNSTQQYSVNCFMNLTSQDAAGFIPQYMYESVLKTATNNPNFSFTTITTPYPVLYVLKQRGNATVAFDFAYMVTIAIALIPCVMIAFILKEREDSLKHMQLISGMNLPAYWISNLAADMIKVYIPMILIILTYLVFSISLPGVWVLFLLYPLAIVPFTYLTSFLFSTDSRAQILTILVTYATGNVLAFVIFFLQLIPQTMKAGDLLRWLFCIFPSYTLINGILWSSCGSLILQVRQSNPAVYPQLPSELWAWKNLGGDAAILIAHFVIDTLILVLIELDLFKCLSNYSFKKIPEADRSLQLDENVVQEEVRVAATTTDVIRVNDFRKAYTSLLGDPFLAVERISFGLDYGECFALLGVNGAGKSTMFKCLTADEKPSQGQITVDGFDIEKEFAQARQLIGYCPQKDAIFPLMSVEEHLWFYARIKGIPKDMQSEIIETTIQEMSLTEHRLKPAGTLSGGNKRKLSVAMAIIGNPPIILLDEPSAGMDPEARRFMWSVVANISQRDKQSAVILTTHSMEEAEALSTKMGIMVRGGIFRCYGSSQHIKNKYGTGYECQIKILKPKEQDLIQLLQSMGFTFTDIMTQVYLNEALATATTAGINDVIIGQVTEKGIGSDLHLEAFQCDGKVRLKNLATYIYIQQYGVKVITLFAQLFSQVELMEQCSEFFNLRFAKEGKTIGFVFGQIEDYKKQLNISEYSVFQTSLEQIFQTFANSGIKDDKAAFVFRINALDQLELLNADRRSTIGQKRQSTTGLMNPRPEATDLLIVPNGVWVK